MSAQNTSFTWNDFLGQISDIATAWLRNKLDIDTTSSKPIVNTEAGKDIVKMPDYSPYFLAGFMVLIAFVIFKK